MAYFLVQLTCEILYSDKLMLAINISYMIWMVDTMTKYWEKTNVQMSPLKELYVMFFIHPSSRVIHAWLLHFTLIAKIPKSDSHSWQLQKKLNLYQNRSKL